ncbi:unnamed protein product [Didymodactylos carnosus]|uniref:Uncharacterized protein n=1 Tax=Didymodactylos carnosus TaxID=1234261 RepID=A0A814AYM9_9BILA|nr:unnamed protein product [Didymodactylos carnosus]CAF1011469.1 unnamed protein product [Didymodactylos carnosus]CAF3698372.1 unnamed protein product [Didymodactylos carnosus]CAF3780393.1 unnamed protein product [Didymodactylos carnosus]
MDDMFISQIWQKQTEFQMPTPLNQMQQADYQKCINKFSALFNLPLRVRCISVETLWNGNIEQATISSQNRNPLKMYWQRNITELRLVLNRKMLTTELLPVAMRDDLNKLLNVTMIEIHRHRRIQLTRFVKQDVLTPCLTFHFNIIDDQNVLVITINGKQSTLEFNIPPVSTISGENSRGRGIMTTKTVKPSQSLAFTKTVHQRQYSPYRRAVESTQPTTLLQNTSVIPWRLPERRSVLSSTINIDVQSQVNDNNEDIEHMSTNAIFDTLKSITQTVITSTINPLSAQHSNRFSSDNHIGTTNNDELVLLPTHDEQQRVHQYSLNTLSSRSTLTTMKDDENKRTFHGTYKKMGEDAQLRPITCLFNIILDVDVQLALTLAEFGLSAQPTTELEENVL